MEGFGTPPSAAIDLNVDGNRLLSSRPLNSALVLAEVDSSFKDPSRGEHPIVARSMIGKVNFC